jgi:protein TonB
MLSVMVVALSWDQGKEPPAPQMAPIQLSRIPSHGAPPVRSRVSEAPGISKMTTVADSPSPGSAPASSSPVTGTPHADSDAMPQYRTNPFPSYPESARRRHQEGTVILSVRVSTTGTPLDVTLKTSSGISALDTAAITTVRLWTFSPARRGTQTVESWVEIPIYFRIKT